MLEKVIHTALDILFPQNCLGCGEENTIACEACLAGSRALCDRCFFCLSPVSLIPGICANCKEKYPLEKLVWVFSYRTPLMREVIRAFKYRKRHSAARELGLYIREALVKNPTKEELWVIPIPLYRKRERARGFNQALLLAQHLEYTIIENALVKIRETPPQAQAKSRQERFEQIKGAFGVMRPDFVASKNILLIDDVATTGATILEAARVLKEAGAKTVSAAVLAHG